MNTNPIIANTSSTLAEMSATKNNCLPADKK